MPGVYVPIGSININPPVSIYMNTINYSEFLNAIDGDLNLFIVGARLTSKTLNQLLNPFAWQVTHPNGDQISKELKIFFNPESLQNSVDLNLIDQQLMIDGDSVLSFILLANESFNIEFHVIQFNIADLLENEKNEHGFYFIEEVNSMFKSFRQQIEMCDQENR